MTDANWPEDPRIVTDAEYEVVRGAFRPHEEHPDRPGWRFTGAYDGDGDPLWSNMVMGDKHPTHPRAEFIGIYDDKGRPLYYVRPRFFGGLQDPITLNRRTWESRSGWKRSALRVLVPMLHVPLASGEYRTRASFIYCATFIIAPFWFFLIGALIVGANAGLHALVHAVGQR